MSSLSASASIGNARPQKPSPEVIERAQRNLAAVQTLRATPAFTEFFMGALRDHRDKLAKEVMESDAEKFTPEKREQQRLIVRQYDKVILSALDDAEVAANRAIQSLDASAGQPARR